MSTPLSLCDISARYGQMPAPQPTIEEQTGWNPKHLFLDDIHKVIQQSQSVKTVDKEPLEAMQEAFLDNMRKAEECRKQKAKEAEEDALMAVIDAMNAPEKDKESGRLEQTLTKSLVQAGKSIAEQSEDILEDGTKSAGYVDPLTHLSVRVLLSCLGDRFNFEQVDEVQENTQEAQQIQETQEEEAKEECLDVTEQRDLSGTGNPSDPTTLERR